MAATARSRFQKLSKTYAREQWRVPDSSRFLRLVGCVPRHRINAFSTNVKGTPPLENKDHRRFHPNSLFPEEFTSRYVKMNSLREIGGITN